MARSNSSDRPRSAKVMGVRAKACRRTQVAPLRAGPLRTETSRCVKLNACRPPPLGRFEAKITEKVDPVTLAGGNQLAEFVDGAFAAGTIPYSVAICANPPI